MLYSAGHPQSIGSPERSIILSDRVSIGLWFIQRSISQIHAKLGRMAFIGWIAVTLGGLFKAIWKLCMALSNGQLDIVVFDKGLFVWLGFGFLLMVYAWSYAMRVVDQRNPRQNVWLWPAISSAVFLAAAVATGFPDPARSTWRFVLLGLLTISNITRKPNYIAYFERPRTDSRSNHCAAVDRGVN